MRWALFWKAQQLRQAAQRLLPGDPRSGRSRALSLAEQVEPGVAGGHPYRAAGRFQRLPPPPARRAGRVEYRVRLPQDMVELQKRLIGEVLCGRCSHVEALGRWKAAVSNRDDCRAIALRD